jgi:hypothetical protein
MKVKSHGHQENGNNNGFRKLEIHINIYKLTETKIVLERCPRAVKVNMSKSEEGSFRREDNRAYELCAETFF